MRFSLFSLLPLALAAPTYPSLDLSAANAQDGVDALSDYFNFLAEKTRRYKALDAAPACELSRAVLPTGKLLSLPLCRPRLHLSLLPHRPSQKKARTKKTNTLQPPTLSPPPKKERTSSTSP